MASNSILISVPGCCGSRARGAVADAYQRIVLFGDLANDRQPEAAAVDVGTQNAIKAVEHTLPLGLGNSRTAVFHFQEHRPLCVANPDRDPAAARRVTKRIVEQVLQHFTRRRRVQRHAAGRSGSSNPRSICRATAFGTELADEVARQRQEIDHFEAAIVTALVLRPRQGKQLIDQVRGPLGRMGMCRNVRCNS